MFRFQLKYHPDVCEAHKANQLKAYAVRLESFKKLESVICDAELTVDLNKDQALTRLLDSGNVAEAFSVFLNLYRIGSILSTTGNLYKFF